MKKLGAILCISGGLLLSVSAVSCKDSLQDGTSNSSPELTNSVDETDTIYEASTTVKEHKNADAVVMAYLTLKNTLMESESESSKKIARKLIIAFKQFDVKSFSSEEQKELKDILEDAIEQTTHISGSKLVHQREHFVAVSEDVLELIAIAGTTKTLYQDFCPMFNDGKGAVWISETKAIKNPYFGAGKMLGCGSIQEVIN